MASMTVEYNTIELEDLPLADGVVILTLAADQVTKETLVNVTDLFEAFVGVHGDKGIAATLGCVHVLTRAVNLLLLQEADAGAVASLQAPLTSLLNQVYGPWLLAHKILS